MAGWGDKGISRGEGAAGSLRPEGRRWRAAPDEGLAAEVGHDAEPSPHPLPQGRGGRPAALKHLMMGPGASRRHPRLALMAFSPPFGLSPHGLLGLPAPQEPGIRSANRGEARHWRDLPGTDRSLKGREAGLGDRSRHVALPSPVSFSRKRDPLVGLESPKTRGPRLRGMTLWS